MDTSITFTSGTSGAFKSASLTTPGGVVPGAYIVNPGLPPTLIDGQTPESSSDDSDDEYSYETSDHEQENFDEEITEAPVVEFDPEDEKRKKREAKELQDRRHTKWVVIGLIVLCAVAAATVLGVIFSTTSSSPPPAPAIIVDPGVNRTFPPMSNPSPTAAPLQNFRYDRHFNGFDEFGKLGASVSMSGDHVAVGAPGAASGAGEVLVYEALTPSMIGTNTIMGDGGFNSEFRGVGHIVRLEQNGTMLAVAGEKAIKVYKLVDGRWEQHGQDVGSSRLLVGGDLSKSSDWSITSISVDSNSRNGTLVIAIAVLDTVQSLGLVHVFSEEIDSVTGNVEWVRIGEEPLHFRTSTKTSLFHVVLTKDATRLVVGIDNGMDNSNVESTKNSLMVHEYDEESMGSWGNGVEFAVNGTLHAFSVVTPPGMNRSFVGCMHDERASVFLIDDTGLLDPNPLKQIDIQYNGDRPSSFDVAFSQSGKHVAFAYTEDSIEMNFNVLLLEMDSDTEEEWIEFGNVYNLVFADSLQGVSVALNHDASVLGVGIPDTIDPTTFEPQTGSLFVFERNNGPE